MVRHSWQQIFSWCVDLSSPSEVYYFFEYLCNMADEIVNKVAQAQIEQIDLIQFKSQTQILGIDLKELLWNELVLKEKEFRDWVKNHDWEQYTDKTVALYCSNEAIVPAWAYMLICSKLLNSDVRYGSPEFVKGELFFEALNSWDISHLEDKRVMVKGCSDIPEPNKAYVILTNRLIPVVKSFMFGEPCSAVPVYKKR